MQGAPQQAARQPCGVWLQAGQSASRTGWGVHRASAAELLSKWAEIQPGLAQLPVGDNAQGAAGGAGRGNRQIDRAGAPGLETRHLMNCSLLGILCDSSPFSSAHFL